MRIVQCLLLSLLSLMVEGAMVFNGETSSGEAKKLVTRNTWPYFWDSGTFAISVLITPDRVYLIDGESRCIFCNSRDTEKGVCLRILRLGDKYYWSMLYFGASIGTESIKTEVLSSTEVVFDKTTFIVVSVRLAAIRLYVDCTLSGKEVIVHTHVPSSESFLVGSCSNASSPHTLSFKGTFHFLQLSKKSRWRDDLSNDVLGTNKRACSWSPPTFSPLETYTSWDTLASYTFDTWDPSTWDLVNQMNGVLVVKDLSPHSHDLHIHHAHYVSTPEIVIVDAPPPKIDLATSTYGSTTSMTSQTDTFVLVLLLVSPMVVVGLLLCVLACMIVYTRAHPVHAPAQHNAMNPYNQNQASFVADEIQLSFVNQRKARRTRRRLISCAECPICLDPLMRGNAIAGHCGHQICEQCTRHLFADGTQIARCPLCRIDWVQAELYAPPLHVAVPVTHSNRSRQSSASLSASHSNRSRQSSLSSSASHRARQTSFVRSLYSPRARARAGSLGYDNHGFEY